ncbi:MAG TPA: hypothetical protein V6D14_09970 [Coleofasciculaceae cyanobacterium]|jgi:hypothetical protein
MGSGDWDKGDKGDVEEGRGQKKQGFGVSAHAEVRTAEGGSVRGIQPPVTPSH